VTQLEADKKQLSETILTKDAEIDELRT
jgi:SMC interacting uncharacterized protein involved in chromosome segregation